MKYIYLGSKVVEIPKLVDGKYAGTYSQRCTSSFRIKNKTLFVESCHKPEMPVAEVIVENMKLAINENLPKYKE